MISITIKDNQIIDVPSNYSGYDVAAKISPSLAKKAIAININNVLSDLDTKITENANVTIVTAQDQQGVEIIRHSSAHLMAHAVKQLFPETQITIGPIIENGFYYDFHRAQGFILEDLAKIEARMHQLVKKAIPIKKEVWQRNEAVDFFKQQGEHYKAEIIESIPGNETITLYRQDDFIDLCRGPHVPNTGKIGQGFKLTKLAGSYWRGDSNNAQLQRIYGTAWSSQQDLQNYLYQLEEAAKRDHRILGTQLGLFHLQDEAPGNIFWHNKGWFIYRTLQEYIRKKVEKAGYIEVNTPVLVSQEFWEKSGHWDKFREHMFVTEKDSSNKIMALKPMNCPCHVQIFKQGVKSYRDLPIRMAEFGYCNRNEPSGSLHGLMRVRAFTQDDAHIFCTEDQITQETQNFCELLSEVYKDLGFTEFIVKFSDRPEIRAGSDDTWDKAEKYLLDAVKITKLDYSINKGEGAFYGPKLEFVLKDSIGRSWQCGTLQVDCVLPEKLDANYIDNTGQKRRPVMIHRAILGSLERFIGILLEHHAGKLPMWLTPVQIGIVTITDKVNLYAEKIYTQLKEIGIRCEFDRRNEKMHYKIRNFANLKVPYTFIIGNKEQEDHTVNVRVLGEKETKNFALQEILAIIVKAAKAPL